MTVVITFVRHGESEDNLKSIWAGWKDAPLSDLGRKQAAAAGEHFSTTKFHAIYASPLLRANATAQAIHGRQQEPFPSFIVTPHIREQHFGVAEGSPWTYTPPEDKTLDELFADGIYPVLYDRDEKFPSGESLNDLASRADRAIMECVIPHLKSEGDFHIALVSHGLCISELVAALLRLDPDSRRDVSYKGLLNTAWTRVSVSVKDPASDLEEGVPALNVQVTHVNEAGHLDSLQVPPTSNGTENTEARKFFAGAEVAEATQTDEKQKL
ncbi:phosphoglycerate mutase [Lentinula raphanica]|uniref:Phosphoglycerate mutase n=1 Tax=Lentinula raphanica TaxID=153919 RepID=A0AA38PB44_9AGAR|nr:phosphoglycerate mutase [Lentinula raphanica]KAJ3973679.1 phosphoglycerate mutase [Lentinula raphanica]